MVRTVNSCQPVTAQRICFHLLLMPAIAARPFIPSLSLSVIHRYWPCIRICDTVISATLPSTYQTLLKLKKTKDTEGLGTSQIKARFKKFTFSVSGQTSAFNLRTVYDTEKTAFHLRTVYDNAKRTTHTNRHQTTAATKQYWPRKVRQPRSHVLKTQMLHLYVGSSEALNALLEEL